MLYTSLYVSICCIVWIVLGLSGLSCDFAIFSLTLQQAAMLSPRPLLCVLLMAILAWQWIPLADAQTIAGAPDVPSGTPLAAAIGYIKTQGIMRGYEDGTFRPQQKVTRAEAIKTIVGAVIPDGQMMLYTGVSSYKDVDSAVWYAPYVEAARTELRIIDGPPKSVTFRGASPVQQAEFLKLLFLAKRVDVQGSYAEVRLPLSTDVAESDAWFYPYMRYGISASMLFPDESGALQPGKELTRGDVAQLLYHFLMYQEGRRVQSLLSSEEADLIATIRFLELKNITLAEQASTRAMLSARGAHAKRSDTPLLQSAVKVAEAFHSLILAYRAGLENRMEDAITASKNAWALADKAKLLSPDLENLTTQVKLIAESMAQQGRAIE